MPRLALSGEKNGLVTSEQFLGCAESAVSNLNKPMMTSLWHSAISLASRQHLYDIAVFRSESRLLTQHREQSLVTRPFPHEWVGSGHERRLWSDPFLMSGWGLDTRDDCDQTLSSWVGGVWTRETSVTRPLPRFFKQQKKGYFGDFLFAARRREGCGTLPCMNHEWSQGYIHLPTISSEQAWNISNCTCLLVKHDTLVKTH